MYDENEREVIPYPQNSEYVLIDVINENDVVWSSGCVYETNKAQKVNREKVTMK